MSSDSSGTLSTTTRPNTVNAKKIVTPNDNLSAPPAGSRKMSVDNILSR